MSVNSQRSWKEEGSTHQLVGGSKTGRSTSDDGDALAGSALGRVGDHPPHLETLVDHRALDGLDANWRLVDAEDARPFARGRTDSSSKLGEVVGEKESVERVSPLVVEDEVVPLGDDIAGEAFGEVQYERPSR
jgi:hypothetical protein